MMGWSPRGVPQAAVSAGVASAKSAIPDEEAHSPRCPIRTITAGVTLAGVEDLRPIERALALLQRARSAFEDAGCTVQTVRIATSPLLDVMNAQQRARAMRPLLDLDRLLQERKVSAAIGPCSRSESYDPELAPWTAELLNKTSRLRCSIRVAHAECGVDDAGARMAAETMVAISRVTPEGHGNFQFGAAACVPPGTPFYPVAFHEGRDAIAVGLESAALVHHAIADASSATVATARVRDTLNRALAPIERFGAAVAERERCAYLGIDCSPAPSLQASIGAAIEAFTKRPFGETGTVEACAAVTAALRNLQVRTCGYSGLMLPVLEDRVLAQRASEGQFTLHDLLLFSSVCGTGLDVVPIPGDTPVDVVTRIIRDTAAVASRWAKPLAARLFLVPGKRAGEMATFSDPELTRCRVMAV